MVNKGNFIDMFLGKLQMMKESLCCKIFVGCLGVVASGMTLIGYGMDDHLVSHSNSEILEEKHVNMIPSSSTEKDLFPESGGESCEGKDNMTLTMIKIPSAPDHLVFGYNEVNRKWGYLNKSDHNEGMRSLFFQSFGK